MKVCFKVSIYTVSIMSKLTKMQREICSLISSWGYNVAPHKEIPYIWVFCGYSIHKEFSTYSTSLGVTLNTKLADVVFVAYCVCCVFIITVPTNGLVVYCGTIVTDDGKEKKVNIDFEPFKPINTSLYLCDNKFHTEVIFHWVIRCVIITTKEHVCGHFLMKGTVLLVRN